MTEIDLQKEIKKILLDEVFKDMLIFDNQEMQVFEYDVPLSSDFDNDDDDSEPFFPCCIVRTRGGEINNASNPQLTTVEIIVCVKDMSEDMSGHKLTAYATIFLQTAGLEKNSVLCVLSNGA